MTEDELASSEEVGYKDLSMTNLPLGADDINSVIISPDCS